MSDKAFYQLFGLVTASAFIMTFLLMQLESMKSHIGFLIFTAAFFMGFTLWAYHTGKKNVKHSNKQVFSRFFLKSVAFKFLITIVILVVYKLGLQPENNAFGLPFIIIYLLFSFCENYALIKMSKPSLS